MSYFEFMEHIDKLSKKVEFSRDDISDIIDYISLSMGFSVTYQDFNNSNFVISSSKLQSIFTDLWCRFGPRPSDE